MKVAVIMGSKSDLPVMQDAIDTLALFEIETHVDIVSAHRTADKMMSFGKSAHENGIDVIIAGAGGAAHLPGMVASISPLPVIGVPVKSSNSIDGWDSCFIYSANAWRRTCCDRCTKRCKKCSLVGLSDSGREKSSVA
jgi:5-(carboxyamino)imidazole ribonucleotide mutase